MECLIVAGVAATAFMAAMSLISRPNWLLGALVLILLLVLLLSHYSGGQGP